MIGVVAIAACGAAAALAADSGSVQVSPASTTVTYAGGTYTVSNPTPPPSAGGVSFTPTCDNNICDQFTLTVAQIPDDYATTHPDDREYVLVTWPNTTADFDLWVYDSTGTTVALVVQNDHLL
jgi:hypothetical protein